MSPVTNWLRRFPHLPARLLRLPQQRLRACNGKRQKYHHQPCSGGTSLLQARTVNEVVKAQTNKVRLARLKGELVDRSQAVAHVFKLARAERDAWLNWPARISSQMAAGLGVDAHVLHVALDAAVRQQLQDLGDLQAKVD